MSNSKHTPTPWGVENWLDDTSIVSAEGSLICTDTAYYPVAPSEEDMAHIVKCVNMHDELVEALKDISRITKGDVSLDSKTSAVARLNHVISLASETLKKAGAL